MTWSPLLNADLQVQLHLLAALLGTVLGPIALYRKRRDWVHKLVGRIWVGVMAFLAVSGLFIHGIRVIGPFSPIHLLSLFVLYSLWRGIGYIRAGNITGHQRTMRQLYWQALGIAGLFTLLPGRVLHRMFLSDTPNLAWALIALGIGAIVVGSRRPHRLQTPHRT